MVSRRPYPVPGFLLRLGNSAASTASRVRCNVHQRNLVVARAFTFPPHSMPVFIDESPGKRRLVGQGCIHRLPTNSACIRTTSATSPAGDASKPRSRRDAGSVWTRCIARERPFSGRFRLTDELRAETGCGDCHRGAPSIVETLGAAGVGTGRGVDQARRAVDVGRSIAVIIGNDNARQFRPDPTRQKAPAAADTPRRTSPTSSRIGYHHPTSGRRQSACAAVRPSRAASMHDARLIATPGRVDEVTHADADETRDSRRTDPRRAPHQR